MSSASLEQINEQAAASVEQLVECPLGQLLWAQATYWVHNRVHQRILSYHVAIESEIRCRNPILEQAKEDLDVRSGED